MASPTYTQPLQVLPSWLSYASNTVTDATGGLSVSLTVVQLPLTYYGPSIPLPSDGSWVYGGLSSPAPTTTPPISTPTIAPQTSTSIPNTSLIASSSSSSETSSSTPSPPSSTPSSLISSSPTSSQGSTPPFPASSSSSSALPAPHHGLTRDDRTGIIVGVIFGVLAIAVLCLCLLRARRKRRSLRTEISAGDYGVGSLTGDDEWEWVAGPNAASNQRPTTPRSRRGSAPSNRRGPSAAVTMANDTASGTENHTNDGTSGPRDSEGPISSDLFVPVVSPNPQRFSWLWSGRDRDSSTVLPVAQSPPIDQGVQSPQSPQSPTFAAHKDSTEAEREGLLQLGQSRTMPATADTPGASSSTGGLFRHVARARELVAARARASYVPGSVGFFTYIRGSWSSSKRSLPGRVDEYGYRVPSEKSSRQGSRHASKQGSKQSSKKGSSGRRSDKPPSLPLSHKSEKSEKSQLIVVEPISEHERDSPDTPTSDAFPSPPATFGGIHAYFRQQQQSFGSRPASGYSTGASAVSGNTVYHDAVEDPLHSSSAPRTPDLPPSSMLRPQLLHLQLPSPISSFHLPQSPNQPQQRSSSQLSTPPMDILDEPAPLPTVSLHSPRDGSGSLGSGPRHDTTPSPTDRRRLAPPGLEHFRRNLTWDRPISTHQYSGLVDLEEEPPVAVVDWRRLTGGADEPQDGQQGRLDGIQGHYRRSTLGQVVFVPDYDHEHNAQASAFYDHTQSRSANTSFSSVPRGAGSRGSSSRGGHSRFDTTAHSNPSSHSLSPSPPHINRRMPSMSTFGVHLEGADLERGLSPDHYVHFDSGSPPHREGRPSSSGPSPITTPPPVVEWQARSNLGIQSRWNNDHPRPRSGP